MRTEVTFTRELFDRPPAIRRWFRKIDVSGPVMMNGICDGKY